MIRVNSKSNPAINSRNVLRSFISKSVEARGKRVLMVVGNRIQGDSRVLKSALSLAAAGQSVLLVGMRPMKSEYDTGMIENIPYVLVNCIEIVAESDADSHRAAMATIGRRILPVASLFDTEVLYTHDYWGLDFGAQICRSLVYKSPIYWVHDTHEYVHGYSGVLPAGRMEYAIAVEANCIGIPDRLVFVNERIRDLLENKYCLQSTRLNVLHNAPRAQVDSTFNARSALGLKDDVPLGIYLGRANKARGLGDVIGCLKAIPDLHIVLMSAAIQDYITGLNEQAQKHGVADRLHVFGYVADNEVADAARSATFGLSPLSRYGNADLALPTKVLEFVHAGLPMVVSDASYQKEFVDEHDLGEVFVSGDVESLVAAVKRLLARQKEIRLNAPWDTLARRYSWETQFSTISKAIFEDLAANSLISRGVFQGPAPSAGQPGVLAGALRALGMPAQSVNVGVTAKFGHHSDIHWPAPNIKNQASLTQWATARFDIFHLHYRPIMNVLGRNGYNPPAFYDFFAIKASGKPLIFQFRGSEIRINEEFRAHNPYAWQEVEDPSRMDDACKKQLRTIVRESADLILVADPEMQTYVPEAKILPRSIDLEKIDAIERRTFERIRVVHAPTRRGVKGTELVLEAIERLRDRGHDFDFVLLENLPHDRLLYELAAADIVIDQLLVGWYGVLSVEAMAFGKAVVAYIREDLATSHPELPLLNANPDSLLEKLDALLQNTVLRESLGMRARLFVEEYHCSKVVAAQARQYYQEVLSDHRSRPISPLLWKMAIESNSKAVASRKRENGNANLSFLSGIYRGMTASYPGQKRWFDPPISKIIPRAVRRLGLKKK
jgi:glycosyltransferase involved in cell wall biosynthesis